MNIACATEGGSGKEIISSSYQIKYLKTYNYACYMCPYKPLRRPPGTCKSVYTSVLMQASCAPLFKKVTHDQFTSQLLSPSLKCLLRNPDELLEGTCTCIHVYMII